LVGERPRRIADDGSFPRLAVASTVPLTQSENPIERTCTTVADVEEEVTVVRGKFHAPALLGRCHLTFGSSWIEAIPMRDRPEDAELGIGAPQFLDALKNRSRKVTHLRECTSGRTSLDD
jgi:hypothetical protein